MENNSNSFPLFNDFKGPGVDLFILFIFIVLGMLLSQFLGLISVLPFFEYKIDLLKASLENPTGNQTTKIPLMIIQAFSTSCGFILAPILFHLIYEKKKIESLDIQLNTKLSITTIILVLTLIIMPANSIIIEWNQNWVFPESMAGFEEWAKSNEEKLALLTKNLTNLSNPGEITLGLLVFAILPAIGEELVFRGIVQKKLYGLTNNIHVAIWMTGFIFSAIHFQFYGLIPRMILGVLFGYIFYWSGNLSYSIIAHFINNGFTLTMLILRNEGLIDIDIESTEGVPINAVASSLLVTTLILFYLYWYFQYKKGIKLPKYLQWLLG